MKKVILIVVILFSFQVSKAQGFKASISAGYLTEIDWIGFSGDLIYEFNEKWGISTNGTFAVRDNEAIRAKWFALDLNARYKIIDELYALAGGEYLTISQKGLGLGGGNPLGGDGETTTDSEFGVNLGTGYVYKIIDNVNVFAEVKYVFVSTGYLHARLGLLFDF